MYKHYLTLSLCRAKFKIKGHSDFAVTLYSYRISNLSLCRNRSASRALSGGSTTLWRL